MYLFNVSVIYCTSILFDVSSYTGLESTTADVGPRGLQGSCRGGVGNVVVTHRINASYITLGLQTNLQYDMVIRSDGNMYIERVSQILCHFML